MRFERGIFNQKFFTQIHQNYFLYYLYENNNIILETAILLNFFNSIFCRRDFKLPGRTSAIMW